MNKNIRGSALAAFSNIRDAYYKERDAGKTVREATVATIIQFPELPIVEVGTALFMVENDYEKRKLRELNATQAAIYRTVNCSNDHQLAPVL